MLHVTTLHPAVANGHGGMESFLGARFPGVRCFAATPGYHLKSLPG